MEIANKNDDYRLFGYHLKVITDTKGDMTKREFYAEYNATTQVYSDLKVRETIVTTRATNALVTQKSYTVEWFEGTVVFGTKTFTKYFDSLAGYNENVNSRTNLMNKASMWLYGDLITEFGQVTGEANAKEFLRDVGIEVANYIKGDRQPLIDKITNTTRTYMSTTRKNTLNGILNIVY